MITTITKDNLLGDNFLNVSFTSEWRGFDHDAITEFQLILHSTDHEYKTSEKDFMVRNDLGSSVETQITYHILEPNEELEHKLFIWKMKV